MCKQTLFSVSSILSSRSLQCTVWDMPKWPDRLQASHRNLMNTVPCVLQLPEELEKAIGTMTRNEKALIYISRTYCSPASYSLNLNVPPEAEELEFELELIQLIQVRDMFGDGGLIKRRIRDGTGEFPIDCPLQDSVMCIHYKGMLLEGGKIFYNTRTDNPGGEPLEFASGEGAVRGYAFHFELYLGILLN
jgi:hypothetical protein